MQTCWHRYRSCGASTVRRPEPPPPKSPSPPVVLAESFSTSTQAVTMTASSTLTGRRLLDYLSSSCALSQISMASTALRPALSDLRLTTLNTAEQTVTSHVLSLHLREMPTSTRPTIPTTTKRFAAYQRQQIQKQQYTQQLQEKQLQYKLDCTMQCSVLVILHSVWRTCRHRLFHGRSAFSSAKKDDHCYIFRITSGTKS